MLPLVRAQGRRSYRTRRKKLLRLDLRHHTLRKIWKLAAGAAQEKVLPPPRDFRATPLAEFCGVEIIHAALQAFDAHVPPCFYCQCRRVQTSVLFGRFNIWCCISKNHGRFPNSAQLQIYAVAPWPLSAGTPHAVGPQPTAVPSVSASAGAAAY